MRADDKLIKRKDKGESRFSFIVRHNCENKFTYFCAGCFIISL